MSTELRTALRDAVSAPPSYGPDVASIVDAGVPASAAGHVSRPGRVPRWSWRSW